MLTFLSVCSGSVNDESGVLSDSKAADTIAAKNSRYQNLADIERDGEPYQVADCNLALFEVKAMEHPCKKWPWSTLGV